jgi:GntR family transcriptional regulator
MHSGVILAKADPRPIYLQIIEQVRQRIAIGDWPPGHPLPSIRELSAELRVSVITVKRAYLELERDGVITTRQGKGSVVADSPTLPDRLLEQQLAEQLDRLARHAVLMGLTGRELNQRLADAIRRTRHEGQE